MADFLQTMRSVRDAKRRPPEPIEGADTLEAGPEPGLRGLLADMMAKAYGGGKGGQAMGRQSAGLFDWLPGVGEGLSAEDAAKSAGEGDWLNAGISAAGAVPVVGKAVKPAKKAAEAVADFFSDFTRKVPEAEPGYVYHTSPRDNAMSIREEGSIGTYDPSHGSDQETWPDASTNPRSYWGESPQHTVPFSQENPTLWRAKRDERFLRERGTPDLYTESPVTGDLEYYGAEGGWHPALAPEPPAAPAAARDELASVAKVPAQPRNWDIVPDDPRQMSVYEGKQKDPERFHKIGGGVKMDTPLSELSYKTEPTGGVPLPPQKELNPEDLQGGVGLAMMGDKTRSGETLTEVGGIPLTKPQPLEGGFRFGDEFPGSIWAGDRMPMEKILKKANAVSDQGKKRVFGLPTAQGSEGGDFARMMSDPTVDLMRQAEMSPEAKSLLDASMAAKLTDARTGKTRWPGADEVLKHDDWLNTASGNDRAQLAKMMAQSAHANPRVPIAALRAGITDPSLLNRPALTTGMSVGEFDLGRGLISDPAKKHGTYPIQQAGESLGKVGFLPYDWMFPKHAAANLAGKDASQAQRTVMTQIPTQEFDQEWLDQLMERYLARAKG